MRKEKIELSFHVPSVSEMSFREELLGDKETMSYNNKWGGIIAFPKTMWESTHNRLICGKNSFYAYLYSSKEKSFVEKQVIGLIMILMNTLSI